MNVDCGSHARAIEHQVRQPKEISRMFDTTTYQKARASFRVEETERVCVCECGRD